jgi:hypothetical protein
MRLKADCPGGVVYIVVVFYFREMGREIESHQDIVWCFFIFEKHPKRTSLSAERCCANIM